MGRKLILCKHSYDFLRKKLSLIVKKVVMFEKKIQFEKKVFCLPPGILGNFLYFLGSTISKLFDNAEQNNDCRILLSHFYYRRFLCHQLLFSRPIVATKKIFPF